MTLRACSRSTRETRPVPSRQTHSYHVVAAHLLVMRPRVGRGNKRHPVVAGDPEACEIPKLRADQLRFSSSVPSVPEKLVRCYNCSLTTFACPPLCVPFPREACEMLRLWIHRFRLSPKLLFPAPNPQLPSSLSTGSSPLLFPCAPGPHTTGDRHGSCLPLAKYHSTPQSAQTLHQALVSTTRMLSRTPHP